MFSMALKQDLVEVLKPLEGKDRNGIRQWADDTENRGDVEQSAVAQVARKACDLLDKIES